MASDHDHHENGPSFDSSAPFKGLVICCTSIPAGRREAIGSIVHELGGKHEYHLTPECTHLLVGEYNTAKYRHVAQQRCDVKAMDALWIDTVMDMWKKDEAFDFSRTEQQFELRPFETCGVEVSSQTDVPLRGSLLVCSTGFDDSHKRSQLEQAVLENGGRYTGDLTRKCTHLIANKPEGRKFQMAKTWGLHTVTSEWLQQSVERGMILDESKFDTILPANEIGVDAWVRPGSRRSPLGKRSRSDGSKAPEGSKKLRKSASSKLTSQSNQIWGDILKKPSSTEQMLSKEGNTEKANGQQPTESSDNRGTFAGCVFEVHGFPDAKHHIITQAISSLGGLVVGSLQAMFESSSTAQSVHRFLVVPQNSQQDTHPTTSDNTATVTEFYIEKCLHNKTFFPPDQHVIGQPFPIFPIQGFSGLIICTAAFTGIELNHVTRSITQLGAKYDERFHRGTSLLVAKTLEGTRKEKISHAMKWGIPLISSNWLWQCISLGYHIPVDDFIFPELRGKLKTQAKARKPANQQSTSTTEYAAQNAPTAAVGRSMGRFDTSSFDNSPQKKQPPNTKSGGRSTNMSTEFVTARSHVTEAFASVDGPLCEISSAAVNRSPPKQASVLQRSKSEPVKKGAKEPGGSRALLEADAAISIMNDPSLHDTVGEQAALKAKAAGKAAIGSILTSLIDSPSVIKSQSSAPPIRPRKRQILGRALSNASSGTNDDNARPARTMSTTALDHGILAGSLDTHNGLEEKERLPRSTQLEYCDPAATLAKQKVIEQMTGVTAVAQPSKDLLTKQSDTSQANVIGGLRVRVLRKR